MRNFSRSLTLAALISSAAFIGGSGLTISSGWLITMASTHPPIMTLGVSVVLVRFFAIFRSVARYLERILSHSAVFSQLTTLRVELFKSLDRQGVSASRDVNAGTFVKALVDDVERGQEYQLRVALPKSAAIISLAVGVGIGALIQIQTLWITAPASVALLFVIPRAVTSVCKAKSFEIEQHENLYSNSIMASSVGVIEAMMYGFLEERKSENLRLEEKISKSENSLLRSTFISQFLTLSIFGIATVGMMVLVQQLTREGLLPIVQITMIAFLPLVIFEAITAWYPNLYSAGKLLLAQENINYELSKEKSHYQPQQQINAPVQVLELHEMQVDWGKRLAHPLTIKMLPGESLVISGQSGSGKSTLAMGISGLLDYRGSCSINGIEVRSISNLPDLLTGALQQSHIFATSVRENLKVANSAASDQQLQRVLDLVELSDISLDTIVGEVGRPLSGGEAKRLSVARALLSRAQIIILDEPTEHIERERAERIEDSIIQACSDRILIVITHSGWLNVGKRVTLTRE
jgi:thiol reductant ABC exporter CydC subunit